MDIEVNITEYWVYIAKCADDTLYTGMTTDVERRIGEHNTGSGAKYTRSRRPITCVYKEQCESRSAALKREAQIKRLSRRDKQKLIANKEIIDVGLQA